MLLEAKCCSNASCQTCFLSTKGEGTARAQETLAARIPEGVHGRHLKGISIPSHEGGPEGLGVFRPRLLELLLK